MHLRPCRARVRLHGGMGPGGRFQPFALASVLRRHHAEPRLALHRHRRHRHHVRPVQGAGRLGAGTSRRARRGHDRALADRRPERRVAPAVGRADGVRHPLVGALRRGRRRAVHRLVRLSESHSHTAHGRRRDGRIGGRNRAVRAGRRLVARGAEPVRHGAAAAGVHGGARVPVPPDSRSSHQ